MSDVERVTATTGGRSLSTDGTAAFDVVGRVWWAVTLPSRALTVVILWLIAGYQRFISPLLPPSCRFVPTCSEYTASCLRKYGLVRGLAKGSYRLLRCHPLCKGGYDPP